MKKAFRYLFAMAFAVVGLVAWASGSLISGFNAVNDETTPDYSTHYDGQSLARSDRYLDVVKLQAGGEEQTITTGQDASHHQIVWDKTDQTFTCKAGEEITASVHYQGSWMHCFVYIDENKDGFIYNGVEDYLDGHVLKVGSDIDLKTFSWFEDYDSKGTFLGNENNAHNTLDMPSFKAPETPGTYRMRYKVDWSWLNPKGRLAEDHNTGSSDDNNTKKNGGCICDVTLVVEAVTSLEVSTTDFFMGAGETAHVAATAPGTITYTSSRPDLVTVNEEGQLTALASTEGKVDVTITVACGTQEATVTVHYDSYGTSISSGSEPGNERYLTTVTTTGATENLNYTEGTYPGATHYMNALSHKLKVEAGQEISLTFVGSEGDDGFKHTKGKAWADWNGNSVFEEETEQLFEAGTNLGATNDFLTGHTVTFTVPETAMPGESRLRMVFVDAWNDGLATLHPTGQTHRGFTIDFDLEIAEASLEQIEAAIAAKLGEANAELALTGLGYPAAESAGRTALAAAVAAAQTATPSMEVVTSLETAIAAFRAEENIAVPENGKYYALTSVNPLANKTYNIVLNEAGDALELSETAEAVPFLFEKHESGETVTYTLKTQGGKYFRVPVHEGANYEDKSTTGLSDEYDAHYNDITLFQHGGEGVRGTFRVAGYRGSADNSYGCVVVMATGVFNSFSNTDGLTANYSNAIRLTEVEVAPVTPPTPENPAIVVEGNLFQNSSLEDWTGTKPDHWGVLTNNGTITQVEDAHSGQYAVSLAHNNSNKRFGGEAIELTAGTYTFSAYVKLAEGAIGAENANKVRMGYAPVVDGAVQTNNYVYKSVKNETTGYNDAYYWYPTAEWQQFSWTFELTETKTVSFCIMTVAKNPDDFLIDDLCLTKDAEPTPPEVVYPEDPEGGQKIDFSWGQDQGLYDFGIYDYWTNDASNDTENLTAVYPTIADGVLTAKADDTLSLFAKEKCIYKVIYTIVDTENYSKPVASHGTLTEDLENHKLIWTIEEGDDLTVDVQRAMKITATGPLTLAYMTYYTRELVTPAVPTQPEVEGDALEYVYFKQGGKYLGITAISGNNGVNKVDEPQTWQVIPQTDGSVRLKDLEGANISGQNYLYDSSTFSINDLTANPISKLDMQLYLIDTATGIGYPVSELHAGSTYAIYGKNLNKALDNTIVSKGSGSGQYNNFNGVAPTTQGENKVFPETTWWTVEAGVEPAPAEPTPEYYVFNEYTFKYLGTDENNVNVLDDPAKVAFAANEENHTVTMDFVEPTNATQHGMHIGSGCRFSVGTAADAQFYIYEIGEEGIGTLVEAVEAGKTYGFVAKKSNTEIAALTSNVYSAGNSSQRLEGEILEETDGFPTTTMMFSAAAQWTVYATDADLPEPPSFPETVYNVVTNRKTGKLLVANTETNTLEFTEDVAAATKFGVEWTYAEGQNKSYLRTEAGKYVTLVEAGEGYTFTLTDAPTTTASVLEESETRFSVLFPVSEWIDMILGEENGAVVATDDVDGHIYWAWGEYTATPTLPATVATIDPEEGEVESLDHIRLTFNETGFDLYQNWDDATIRPVLTRNGEVVATHSNFNNPPVWVEGAEGEEGYWNYDSAAAEEGVYHVVLREATTAPGTYVLTIPAGAVVYYYDDAEEVGNEEVSFTWTIAGDEPVVADYSTNWDGQNADHGSRYTTAVGITTASNDAQQTTSTLQPRAFQALVWNLADADEPMVFTAQQNEMITPFFNFNGEWMHGYVWVDEDADGFACVADADTHTITGDLKSYTFYSFSDSDETGYNSLGEYITGNDRNNLSSTSRQLPAFAAPAQVGDYRIRFIADWNCIDPMGAPATYATGSTKTNGGIIVDAILRVSPVTGIGGATVDFESQKVFDLQGRRVLKPAHGVFIVNGKKIMVK